MMELKLLLPGLKSPVAWANKAQASSGVATPLREQILQQMEQFCKSYNVLSRDLRLFRQISTTWS